MAQVNTIKDLYENEELSLREIARRTKLSFQTVQKYAYMEDWSEEKLSHFKEVVKNMVRETARDRDRGGHER